MPGNPSIVVVGSVNLDLAASVSRLPVAGETVTGADLQRFPGGKGANQALAARRLGADVSIVARVGDDAVAEEALALLRSGNVNLAACGRDENAPTGMALIAVAPDGDNQIIVAPGANRRLLPDMVELPAADAMICQLEVPVETLCYAAKMFAGFFCINLAPALEVPLELIQRADLIVVNETEAEFYGSALTVCDGLLATTYGSNGAVLRKAGTILAETRPPRVTAVDATAAGDAFTAALTVALVEGQDPEAALRFACVAGAVAATRAGAQPSLPFRKDVEDLLNQWGRTCQSS